MLSALWFALAPAAFGQAPPGEISGTVINGTAGGPIPTAATVQLLELGADGATRTLDATPDEAGRFAFRVDADPDHTYLLRTQYARVQYLSAPLILNSDLPTIDQPVTVYEVTTVAPDLRIATTNLTVLALDRGSNALALERTDVVINPGDRVFVGAAPGSGGSATSGLGVTLRIPLPEDTAQASGLSEGSVYQVEEGLLLATVPLLPGENRVVSRYLVGYDPARDTYRLRVTAPLPTTRMELLVPTGFAEALNPESGALPAGEVEMNETQLDLFVLDNVPAGQSGVLTLDGLSGRNSANPLTGTGGALAGLALAMVAVAGGAWGLAQWRAAQRGH